MVVNERGLVSKHYYAGSEKIASRLAGHVDDFVKVNAPVLSQTYIDNLIDIQRIEVRMYCQNVLGTQYIFQAPPPVSYYGGCDRLELWGQTELAKQCRCETQNVCADVLYYYHPDQVGSSTFLSDAVGQPYQFLLYLPFGETMAEQNGATTPENTAWSTPYMFNAKELDDNTGLYYYGARYYDPRISIWHGVDPLAEMYPNWSPYTYTMNNPITYSDPTGMSTEGGGGGEDPVDGGVYVEPTITAQRGMGITRDNLRPINSVSQTFQYPQSNQQLPNSSSSSSLTQAGPYLTWGSTLFSGIGELKYSSPRLGYGNLSIKNPIETWIGKDLKIYSGHSGKGPNRWSGSRGASMVAARPFKLVGTTLGVLNYLSIGSSYLDGSTSGYNTVWELGSNTISTFGGLPGIGWGIGWELGRYTTSRPSYRKNVRPRLQELFGIRNDEYWYCSFCGNGGQWMPYIQNR